MILQRYILKELLLYYLFIFSVILSLFVAGMMLQSARSLEGVALGTLARMIPQTIFGSLAWVMLTATAPSVTLVFARFSSDNEIDAMRTCGIAAGRVMAPGVLFGLILTSMSYLVLEYVAPDANYARRTALKELLLEVLKSPPPGKQFIKIGSNELSYLDSSEGVMRFPLLRKFASDLLEIEYSALKGKVLVEQGKVPRIVLTNLFGIQHDAKGRMTHFSIENDLTVELPTEEALPSEKRPDMMTLDELYDASTTPSTLGRHRWILMILWSRVAQSLVPLLFVLVSMPIGVLVRRGSRLAGLGASVPIFILYLAIYFAFQGMGQNDRIPIVVAAFAPDVVLALLAMALLQVAFRR